MIESILLPEDATCRQCGTELPAGRLAMVEPDAPPTEVGVYAFCDEDCYTLFYDQDGVDQAREDGIKGNY